MNRFSGFSGLGSLLDKDETVQAVAIPSIKILAACAVPRGLTPMFISEIFYSIQGGSELTGVPSVFIRTSGCNLRCNGCDTDANRTATAKATNSRGALQVGRQYHGVV